MPNHNESTSSAFDQLSLGGSSPSSLTINPKVFRDGRAARSSDVFIALMGVTGSGKSSFISLCSQKAAKVGHDLRACTTDVDVYAYELSASRTVYLIDTPGFDDTNRSDTDVLREIAGWLTTSYSNKVLLHGIIYLHRVTDIRMQGSAAKNLLMFKKLCGDNALRKVVLATTMWDKVPPHEAEDREQQLVNTPNFWGLMVSKGSTVYRHNNTVESAVQIIEKLSRDNNTVTLDLQNQMVNNNQTLKETAAGRELESEMIKERQKWAAELKDAQEQIKEAIRLRDKESEQMLQELKHDYNTRMERLELDQKRLHIDTERLRDARIERLEEALEMQNNAHANKIKELQQENVKLQRASKNIIDVPRPLPTPISMPMTRSSSLMTRSSSLMTRSSSLMTRSSSFDAYQETGPFSASLHADRWTLNGPKSYQENCLSYPSISNLRLQKNLLYFLVTGTSKSYVYKYKVIGGGHMVIQSKNLDMEYPQLHHGLDNTSVEPLWICLGPNETFYTKYRENNFDFWLLPPSISSKLKKIKGEGVITAVALGTNGTYVIVYGNNWVWDLKSCYGNLGDYLRSARSAPRFVALNSHNSTDFLFLGATGTMQWNMSCTFQNQDEWKKFHHWRDYNGV